MDGDGKTKSSLFIIIPDDECIIFVRGENPIRDSLQPLSECTRLVNTSDTILNICLDSGFDSQRTFNRVFKERYRTAPSEYRKNKRRNG